MKFDYSCLTNLKTEMFKISNKYTYTKYCNVNKTYETAHMRFRKTTATVEQQ